jgi:polyisoprenoid-binding protein YceI
LLAISIIDDDSRRSQVSTISTSTTVGTWKLDTVHSSVGFDIAYLGGTFRGQFREVEAELDLGEPQATLVGAASVASVDVKDENLAVHLQSPDFFDAERYPELRFVARDLEVDGEEVTARGELTIKDVTKPVVVTGTISQPLTDPYGNERIGLEVGTTVDRTDFGVSWNAELPNGQPALSNEVRLVAELFFVRQA